MNTPFLERLTESDRRQILDAGIRHHRRSGVIAHQGDPHTTAMIILRGLVKVTVVHPQGTESLVDLRGAGDILGAEALDYGRPRETTVTTCEATSLVMIPSERFRSLIEASPSISTALNMVLADRLGVAVRRQARALQPAPVRLAALLCDLADAHGTRRDDNTVVLSADLSQGELGAAVGTSRETVERALRRWRKEGVISTGYREITLHNMSYLRGMDDLGQAWPTAG